MDPMQMEKSSKKKNLKRNGFLKISLTEPMVFDGPDIVDI